jgi:hypothetical protein
MPTPAKDAAALLRKGDVEAGGIGPGPPAYAAAASEARLEHGRVLPSSADSPNLARQSFIAPIAQLGRFKKSRSDIQVRLPCSLNNRAHVKQFNVQQFSVAKFVRGHTDCRTHTVVKHGHTPVSMGKQKLWLSLLELHTVSPVYILQELVNGAPRRSRRALERYYEQQNELIDSLMETQCIHRGLYTNDREQVSPGLQVAWVLRLWPPPPLPPSPSAA